VKPVIPAAKNLMNMWRWYSAAAIATGYKGLIFIQADHYQTAAKDYFKGKTSEEQEAAKEKAKKKVKDNIRKALLAGMAEY